MNAITLDDWDVLEEKYFGKSALSYETAPVSIHAYPNMTSQAYAPQMVPQQLPGRKQPKANEKKRIEDQKKYRQKILSEYKTKERYVSRKRFKEALAVSLAIVVAASMFSFILYRQSQISTLNFHNNALQREILKTEQETRQINEQIITNADLAQIRWDAMEKLGMQEPSAKQIIVLTIPQADLLVTSTYSAALPGSKASIAEAKVNLARYFSEME
jgi:cell division protein FtsL